MIPHAFGGSNAWSVGIEEELFCLDAGSLEPAPFPAAHFDGARLKAELFTTIVEVTSGACASVEEAVASIAGARAEAKRLAAAHGLVLAAAGTWPTATPEEQPVTPDPRYLRMVERAGPSARRQYCCGLHVHVGVESPERCHAILEAVLPWLPVVLAVSASSPYLAGRESGLASTRAEILRLLPGTGAPPALGSYGGWEAWVEHAIDLGLAESFRDFFWDARPSPEYGTLEVRMPDQPTALEATAALAALLQALAASAGSGSSFDRGLYEQSRWAALRFGREAELVHPGGGRLLSVPELLEELLERVEPAARLLGSARLLAPLETLDQAGEQVALGRREGLGSVCRRLVELT